MDEPRYETIAQLRAAIEGGDVVPSRLTGFICKGELFIRAGTPDDLFVSYYGTAHACEDVCAALGIAEIVHA